jgi:hypothetical protein
MLFELIAAIFKGLFEGLVYGLGESIFEAILDHKIVRCLLGIVIVIFAGILQSGSPDSEWLYAILYILGAGSIASSMWPSA